MLLPLGLILAVLVAWKLGAGPVLSFWLAYILTRPLGANIGDFLGVAAAPTAGSGWARSAPACSSSARSSAVVVYLTKTHVDQTEPVEPAEPEPADRSSPARSEGAHHGRTTARPASWS